MFIIEIHNFRKNGERWVVNHYAICRIIKMPVIPSRIKRAHDRTSCYIKMMPSPIENSVIDTGGV